MRGSDQLADSLGKLIGFVIVVGAVLWGIVWLVGAVVRLIVAVVTGLLWLALFVVIAAGCAYTGYLLHRLVNRHGGWGALGRRTGRVVGGWFTQP